MGIFDLLDSFDAAAYRRRIRSLGRNEICKREIQKRRQLYGAAFKMAGGGALAPFTMGFSLIGTGLGARQYSIAEQKLAVIQQIMKDEGWKFHTETKCDVLIPLGSTVVGMVTGGAVDVGIGHVAAHYIASETFRAAVIHPADFANGIEHGIGMGAGQAASVFHAGDMATNSAMATMAHAIPLDSSSATSIGMVLGHTGTLDGIQHAVAWIAGSAVKHGGDKVANSRFRKGTLLDSMQRNNQSLSTRSPKQLRSLLRDYGVAYPVSASRPQLLKIINSIPNESVRDNHVMGRYLLFLLALFGLGIAAFLLYRTALLLRSIVLQGSLIVKIKVSLHFLDKS